MVERWEETVKKVKVLRMFFVVAPTTSHIWRYIGHYKVAEEEKVKYEV